jgi:tetratricopeptide (TPR) repeat protein
MAKKRQPKELEEQLDYEDLSLKIMHWLKANKGLLILAFLALVAGIAAVNFTRAASQRAEQERSFDFVTSLNTYRDGVGAQTAEERRTKLTEAATSFENFANSNDGPLADYALFMAGNAIYYSDVSEENFQNAAELYDQFARRAGDNYFRGLGHYSKAYAYESLGFLPDQSSYLDDALESFETAESTAPNTWIAAEAKLSRARILSARAGSAQEAEKLVREVLADREIPESPDILRDDSSLTDADRELLLQVASQSRTFGIHATAKIMLERLAQQTEL